MKTETAMFGMGCFWSPELLYSKVKGVIKTRVGFAGGKDSKKVSYLKVCIGLTGHAEVIKIWFDPEVISYKKILDIFWEHHDPTQGNRQGPDIGNQYRSIILYNSNEQKELAEKSKDKFQKKLGKEITTEIIKAGKFYEAEEYHQKYLEKRGETTCHI
jgi:peptide-methionine (S)-S-oxide reductase